MYDGNTWWTVFAVTFLLTAVAETFLPFRSFKISTPRRWVNNSALLAVYSVVTFSAYQFTGVALAFSVQGSSHGLLNLMPIRYGLRFVLGFAFLDLTDYLSHRTLHALAPLWRVHQVHHSETELDLTSGLRFHPVEALFAQAFMLVVIALLGPPPAAVALEALAIVFQNFFTHANLRIPAPAERFLRLAIITPDLHRVHHSERAPAQNTNFGTIFSVWDRLFGTYRVPTDADLERSGLAEIADGSRLNAVHLLLLPFRRRPASAPDPLPAARQLRTE